MYTFCLLEWSFNLIVPSLYLGMGMCTFHLVKVSFFFFGYVLLSFGSALSFYLVVRPYHSVMCSFHYLLFYALFVCALSMRCFYALFLCALFMCSLYSLFYALLYVLVIYSL